MLLNPYEPSIAENAALNYIEQKEYSRAVVHLLRAIGGNNPQPAQLLALLVSCLIQLEEYQKTDHHIDLLLTIVERSLAIQPTERGHFVKGCLLFQKQQFDEAMRSYENALSINPHSFSTLIGKAQIHLSKKQYESALNLLDVALQQSNEKEIKQQALQFKCVCLKEMNRLDEAFQSANQLLTLDPKDIGALTIVTTYHLSKNEHKLALERLNAIDNPSVPILELKLTVYSVMGDLDKTLQCCDQILKIEPKKLTILIIKKTTLIALSTNSTH